MAVKGAFGDVDAGCLVHCIEIQIQGALGMGISVEEIDEAAWLGVAFAGAPAMMLYKRVRKSLGL